MTKPESTTDTLWPFDRDLTLILMGCLLFWGGFTAGMLSALLSQGAQ